MKGPRTQKKRRLQWWMAGGVGGLLLAGLLAGGCCLPPPSYEAALGLLDVAAGEEDSALKRRTPAPTREVVHYEVDGRERAADFYITTDSPGGALILVPGAAEQGKDDPRLVAFAETLARLRFAVLVPDMENVRQLRVGPDDVDDIADAAVYLAQRPDLPVDEGVGIVAVSYAVGPAILAALEPRARKHVRFIFGIGGYHDMQHMVAFITTGYYGGAFDGELEEWSYLEPLPYGRWAFLRGNLHRIEEERDRELLGEIAEIRLQAPTASVEPWAEQLGPEGRSIFDLLENRDPLKVPALILELPEPVREELQALDVASRDLSELQARLLLVHGKTDPLIPYTESRDLVERVGRGQARLFAPAGLDHVDLDRPGLADSLRLWCAVDALLRERRFPRHSTEPSGGSHPGRR